MLAAQGLRRVVRGASLTLALVSVLWAVCLVIFGGFAITVFTLTVRSHDPWRPLIVGALSFAVFVRLGGFSVLLAIPAVWRTGRPHQMLAGALVVSVVIVGVAYGSTSAGVSDQYGYLTDAQLWWEGRRAIPQPWVRDVPWPDAGWTFSPLAFAPARGDPSAIVPITSPGLPLLMVLARFGGGACGPFWVVPLAGALLVLSTFLLGQRLGSRDLGLLAAFLVATSLPFLQYLTVPMSDVPVAGALALACWCLLGHTIRSAVLASLALSAVILIRPNLLPLAIVCGAWLGARIIQVESDRTRQTSRVVIAFAGIAAASLCTAVIYWLTYGSPLESGYGSLPALFSTRNIVPNMWNYGRWFTVAQTPVAWLGLMALFVPVRWLWPHVTSREAVPWLAVLVVAMSIEYLAYAIADHPSLLRYFLPGYPFIMLGLSAVVLGLTRLHTLWGPLLGTVVVAVLCAQGFRVAQREHVFQQAMVQAKHADVAEHVRRATPDNSVVLAMQHSGSLRYYAGRVTMRWDLLSPEWLDRAVAWMAERGVPTYALLDDFEQAEMVQRFAGQELTATLMGPPVFRFGSKLFYDLSRSNDAALETVIIPVMDLPPRCLSPVSPPQLTWRKQ
jgi:hypothetical protein